MEDQQIIQKTADFVRNKLSGENSGHGWEHAKAVWENAKEIEKEMPGVNVLVVGGL